MVIAQRRTFSCLVTGVNATISGSKVEGCGEEGGRLSVGLTPMFNDVRNCATVSAHSR